jgi:hypothetical protein
MQNGFAEGSADAQIAQRDGALWTRRERKLIGFMRNIELLDAALLLLRSFSRRLNYHKSGITRAIGARRWRGSQSPR